MLFKTNTYGILILNAIAPGIFFDLINITYKCGDLAPYFCCV